MAKACLPVQPRDVCRPLSYPQDGMPDFRRFDIGVGGITFSASRIFYSGDDCRAPRLENIVEKSDPRCPGIFQFFPPYGFEFRNHLSSETGRPDFTTGGVAVPEF